MKIEKVDWFYLSLPKVLDIGDGSQDALLVRVEGGGLVGWGECEAAPLPSMASWNCPMSHSACKPVSASILGQTCDTPDDVRRMNASTRTQSFDLLQADHTLSGVDIALWDLLGKKMGEPVWRLLGFDRAFPKTPYASQLFGSNPQDTLRAAQKVARSGFRAAKFGWGPYGHGSVEADAQHITAAREGLGADILLLVDAGTVWGDDVSSAVTRLSALASAKVGWLEEPFVSGALSAYKQLSVRSPSVKLAGGEGCHNLHQALNMIEYAGLGFVQIDAGRIGGITTAAQVARVANGKGVQFVNHTFTTQLALSASVQAYAGFERDELCEYPFEPSSLGRDFTETSLALDAQGQIRLPEGPGLGIEPNLAALEKYVVDVEIKVGGRVVMSSTRSDWVAMAT